MNALSPAFHGRPAAKAIEQAWSIRQNHPVWKALNTHASFRNAWKLFERQRKKETASAELSSALAPLRFLREFARAAFDARELVEARRLGKLVLHRPTQRAYRDLDSSMRHARRLLDLLTVVPTSDTTIRLRAELALRELVQDLERRPRKRSGGKRALERTILKGLALSLVSTCGLSSPRVITHFASMFGFDCDDSTAKSYCVEAKRTYGELLAKAVEQYVASGGRKARSLGLAAFPPPGS
jgi:hypothetical protein